MPSSMSPARALAVVLLGLLLSLDGSGPAGQPAGAAVGPLPAARADRFGFVLGTASPAQAQALGLPWHLTCCDPSYQPPAGTMAPRFLPVDPPLAEDDLTVAVRAAPPGTVWLIGNEPNVQDSSPPGFGNVEPAAYARALRFYDQVIRRLDSRARLAGPNILNWETTCTGCAGYPQGRAWTAAMRAAYLNAYRVEPPLDIWTLHVYELDWRNLPNGNAEQNIAEIEAMRAWLDGAGLHARPMWLTEVGIHWGYPGLLFGDNGRVTPVGPFAVEHVERYMREVFGWLDASAERLAIERWFIWAAVVAAPEGFATVYGGIQLYDGGEADAPLSRLGRLYLELAGVR